jgi:hypothetical protein
VGGGGLQAAPHLALTTSRCWDTERWTQRLPAGVFLLPASIHRMMQTAWKQHTYLLGGGGLLTALGGGGGRLLTALGGGGGGLLMALAGGGGGLLMTLAGGGGGLLMALAGGGGGLLMALTDGGGGGLLMALISGGGLLTALGGGGGGLFTALAGGGGGEAAIQSHHSACCVSISKWGVIREHLHLVARAPAARTGGVAGDGGGAAAQSEGNVCLSESWSATGLHDDCSSNVASGIRCGR